MKIVRYGAALLLSLALLAPTAGAIRLVKPKPPATEEAAEEQAMATVPAPEPVQEAEPTPEPAQEEPAPMPEAEPEAEPEPEEVQAPEAEPMPEAAQTPEPTPETVQTPEPAPEPAPVPEPALAPKPAQPEAKRAERDGWNLLLVNPWNPLPEDFTVELATLASCGLKVDKRICGDLEEMFSACRKAGLNPVVCSAYRSQAVQTRLYNNKIARLRAAGYSREDAVREAGHWVAVPGTSEHQIGLALDIVSASYQALNKRQETTAEQKWLMEHCWEYGFILRYPSDKCELTGISYEPWHYRYVGREAALEMRDSGQCLEEYLQGLEKNSLHKRGRPASAGRLFMTGWRSGARRFRAAFPGDVF